MEEQLNFNIVQDSKLTYENLGSMIKETSFTVLGEKTTVCIITLNNGFEVIGTFAPVDKKNFDLEIGKKISYQRALDKLWEIEGYRLQCAMFGDNLVYTEVESNH